MRYPSDRREIVRVSPGQLSVFLFGYVCISIIIIALVKGWYVKYRISQSDVSETPLSEIIRLLSIGRAVFVGYDITGEPELAIKYKNGQWLKIWHLYDRRETDRVISRQEAVDLLVEYLYSQYYGFYDEWKAIILDRSDAILHYLKGDDDEKWFLNAKILIHNVEIHLTTYAQLMKINSNLAEYDAEEADHNYLNTTQDDT